MELFLYSLLCNLKNGVILASFGMLVAYYTLLRSNEPCLVVIEHRESGMEADDGVELESLDCGEINQTLDKLMESLSFFREKVKCDEIFDESATWKTIHNAQRWRFNSRDYEISFFSGKSNVCNALKSRFGFYDKPLSQDEYDYPLAYGFLVHANPLQILLLLSSVYQPQNQFCIAIDDKASDCFKNYMFHLSECFPNIFVMVTGKVHWCEHSVLQGVYGCVQYLAKLKADWKYFQYLSGVDLPLKTNLEMPNVEPPVPLWKSSLSATFTRQAAEFMVTNKKISEVYNYLKGTLCPDESFWATVAGNPDFIPMPGGFNASQWIEKLVGERVPHSGDVTGTPKTTRAKRSTTESGLFVPEKYYISRYQVWYNRSTPNAKNVCYGRFTSDSCVFGVRDLPVLAKRPELIVHKLYLSVQPAAYFCLYELVKRRALLGNTDFNVDAYGELPGPRLMAGTRFEDVEFKGKDGCDVHF